MVKRGEKRKSALRSMEMRTATKATLMHLSRLLQETWERSLGTTEKGKHEKQQRRTTTPQQRV